MVRLISTVLVIALTCGVRGASRSDESITRLTQVYEEYGRSGEPVRSIGAIQMVPKAEPIERTVRLVFDMPKGLPLPTGQLFIQYWSLVSDSARSSPRIIGAEVNGTTTEFTITAPAELSIGGQLLPGYWFRRQHVRVEVDPKPLIVRIALIAAGTIYGSIREVDGSLATAYSVSAIPVDPALNRPTHHTGFNYRGTEGKYFCGSLPLPGKYRVLANGLSRQSRRISVLGPLVVLDKENVAQRVDLTFPRGIDVTGEVTDLKGRPLSGVNVSLNFVLDPSVGQYARGTGSVRTSDNGAFTIPNVAFSVPGTYALHVYRQDFKRRKTVEISPEAIPLTIPFDPREGSEGRGTMRPIRPQPLSIGDVSPEFSFKAVDGQSMKLSDFRGRFVLLYFWATWCGPCKLETPHLKVVHEAFGADRRLAMISLSLDSGPSAPKQYAKENDLQWIQGFLGDWTTTEVPDQYGVQGIPEIILLDPQGRVLRTDLRGEKTLSAVRQALQDK